MDAQGIRISERNPPVGLRLPRVVLSMASRARPFRPAHSAGASGVYGDDASDEKPARKSLHSSGPCRPSQLARGGGADAERTCSKKCDRPKDSRRNASSAG